MNQLQDRIRISDPKDGLFHIVKAGNNVPFFSYYIVWEDMVVAMKKDNPIVVPVIASFANRPANPKVGLLIYVRDETAMYVYDIDESWKKIGGGGGGGLSSIAEPSNAAIRAITSYANGNDVLNYTNGALHEFDDASTGVDNGTEDSEFIKPDDIAIADSGRWKRITIIANISDTKSRTYSIDFGLNTIIAQEINMFGASVITNVIGSNIASILLSYSGGLQQAITPGVNNISVTAGDILTWEITRTDPVLIATLGIHLQIQ